MNKKRKLWIAGGVLVLLMAIGGTTAVAVMGDDGPLTGEILKKASAAALEAAGGGTVTDTESGDEDGAYEVEVTMADGSQVDVHLDSGFKVIAKGTDRDSDDDRPITGESLEKASAAALEAAGGGTVTSTETSEGNSFYEVEVTLENGDQVDVLLDSGFKVVAKDVDREGPLDLD
jgi:uncharacterized membrane protein YkoI